MFWKEREYQHQQKVKRSVTMNAHEWSRVWGGIPLANISVWRRNTCESEDASLIQFSPMHEVCNQGHPKYKSHIICALSHLSVSENHQGLGHHLH